MKQVRRTHRFQNSFRAIGVLLISGAWFSCASGDVSGDSSEEGDSTRGASNKNGANINVGTGASSGSGLSTDGNFNGFGGSAEQPVPDWLPEEIEKQQSYRAPVVTGDYLWSANPESGRVALIRVSELTVRVLSAGLAPTYLTSVSKTDATQGALVINAGSSDVTRFKIKQDVVSQDSVPVHQGANRWSVSTSGKWAVAWSAEEEGVYLDIVDGLQEITVLRLEESEMKATRLTIGYRPSAVLIDEMDERIVVVSEEGISQIDITSSPQVSEWIKWPTDALRDVSLDAAGNFALVREAQRNEVEIIDLKDSSNISKLQFSGRVTDADLSVSGRGAIVVRGARELHTFDLQEILADPTAIDTVTIVGELFGSVELTAQGDTALVYTTAELSKRVTVVDLSEGDSFLKYRVIKVPSPVLGAQLTPRGDHAAILAGDSLGKLADGFTLISLRNERFPRVVGTAGPVSQMALGDGQGIITTASASGIYEAHVVQFPSLSVRTTPLATEPLAVGVLPKLSRGYVAQRYSEGRITFFEFDTESARTLTGFELSAEVVDE